MITLEIDNSTQFATAYRDGKPVATVQRARVGDRSGPQWSGYDLKGNVLFASMLNISADAMIRRIERALEKAQNDHGQYEHVPAEVRGLC